jgi:DNA-binding CsgD family transcriptional regulator
MVVRLWDAVGKRQYSRTNPCQVKVFRDPEDAFIALRKRKVKKVLVYATFNPIGALFQYENRKWQITALFNNINLKNITQFMALSPREHDVATLLQQGARNEEIAEKLGISNKTVSTMVTRIYQKAGIPTKKNTYSLVRTLEKEGLLEPLKEEEVQT